MKIHDKRPPIDNRKLHKKVNMKSKKQVLYVIAPTDYGDFDLLAIGRPLALYKIAREGEVIKSSTYGCSLIVIDTFDTIKDAVKAMGGL